MQAFARIVRDLEWRSAPDVIAVCDSERHLGHAVRLDAWHAFDATKLNATRDAFLYLGVFEAETDAMAAITASVRGSASLATPLVMTAGTRYF